MFSKVVDSVLIGIIEDVSVSSCAIVILIQEYGIIDLKFAEEIIKGILRIPFRCEIKDESLYMGNVKKMDLLQYFIWFVVLLAEYYHPIMEFLETMFTKQVLDELGSKLIFELIINNWCHPVDVIPDE